MLTSTLIFTGQMEFILDLKQLLGSLASDRAQAICSTFLVVVVDSCPIHCSRDKENETVCHDCRDGSQKLKAFCTGLNNKRLSG